MSGRSSLRGLVPAPLQNASRAAYVTAGRLTAGLRLEPGFIMVGASRSGTTSLFRALSAHPQVVRPTVNKGVRYFDLNHARGSSWYRGHFPVGSLAQRRSGASADVAPVMAFEASGYYIYHPFAVPRMADELPDVRIVAMLRDPVERAFSAWKHESARGFEWEPFDRALELEDERLAGEVERMAADPAYESFAHRHQSHRSRGEYAGQLERIYEHFPRAQVHVVQSEVFFAEPAAEYTRLTQFLSLRPFLPPTFGQLNARPSEPMDASIRASLTAHFAPHDARLADLLGEPLRWSQPT